MNPEDGPTPDRPVAPAGDDLAMVLAGNLPCVVCGYNLSGLSVTTTCPECGSAVRATLLAVVDPQAESLEALIHPRLTAAALIVCSLSALAAALVIWTQRIADAVCVVSDRRCLWPVAGWAASGLIASAALGAIGLVRPHRKVGFLPVVSAAAGIGLLLVAAWQLWSMLAVEDIYRPPPYLGTAAMGVDRLTHRAQIGLLLAAAVLLLRPNARMLATRSLVLRRNHENRQRLLALAASIALTVVGDGMLLLFGGSGGGMFSMLAVAGQITIVAGSMLVTAGLIAVAVDSVRIARSIARPPRSFRDVMQRSPGHG